MSSIEGIAARPAHVTAEEHFQPWFIDLAGKLLNNVDLVINGETYRFAELETYYHGPGHMDLFAHCDPVQLEHGRWYFHRTRGEYRGGSFKGLDLALGDGKAHFGILIRTIVKEDGTMLDGPCVTVDHMLEKTKAASVAVLDGIINSRKIWDSTSPLSIRMSAKQRTNAVHTSARVGLTLKKAKGKPDAPKFVARQYRYLSEPLAISKGKVYLVLALHRKGETPEAISELTGSPKKTVERYIKDFTAGQAAANFDAYIGQELSTAELCKMLGTWAAKHGGK
jgi:hypothetical protein